MSEEVTNVYFMALAALLKQIQAFDKFLNNSETNRFSNRCIPDAWRAEIDLSNSKLESILSRASDLARGSNTKHDENIGNPARLRSIFCNIYAEGQYPSEDMYWPVNSLELKIDTAQKHLFPSSFHPEFERVIRQDHNDLWRELYQEAEKLYDAHQNAKAEDLEEIKVYLESLLFLLQRYGWCIPAYECDPQDGISMYDHGRMTAALASLLAESKTGDTDADAQDQNIAKLVGGDITGVQAFLYTITARGATSSLRGRSFYMQLLTEVVARYVLNRLNLPITNLIYAGGGNFYLLARPDDDIEKIQKEIGQILYYHHRGDLYLAVAGSALASDDFYNGKISGIWKKLGEKLQQVKLRKFSELSEDLWRVFEPKGSGGNEEKLCAVCGMEHSIIFEDKKEDLVVRKCLQCKYYEDLGDSLRSANYIVFEKCSCAIPSMEKDVIPGAWGDVLSALGFKVLVSQSVSSDNANTPKIVWGLNDAASESLMPQSTMAVGRKLLVNVTPIVRKMDLKGLKEKDKKEIKEGQIKPFDLLQKQSQGIKRLGVLRMDVDNLGNVFSKGLVDQASLSKIAALSFAVSLYFEGWIEVLAAKKNQKDLKKGLGERLYSIYSGGDDLFFVGSWDAVVELAREIRKDLSPYAANHPGIHASAGISLVGGKYPLVQAAKQAGSTEAAAKDHQWIDIKKEQHKKDSINFLNQSISWLRFGLEEENGEGFKSVYGLMNYLVKREKLHSLLRRLIKLQILYETEHRKRQRAGENKSQLGEEQSLWGPWNWLSVYYLSRNSEARKEDIEKLRTELLRDQFRSIEWIGLAARWAELSLREKS